VLVSQVQAYQNVHLSKLEEILNHHYDFCDLFLLDNPPNEELVAQEGRHKYTEAVPAREASPQS
jgi:hypothetical protein